MRLRSFGEVLLILLCIAAWIGPVVLGSDTAQGNEQAAVGSSNDADLIREAAGILAEIKEPVVQLLGFVSLGSDRGGWQTAQEVVNRLEGRASELWGPTSCAAPESSQGIRPCLAELQAAPPGSTWQWERLSESLRLVSKTMYRIVDEQPSVSETRDQFMISRVLLESAIRMIDELLQTWGYEIWVLYGESIQAAIDAAPAGATINLDPGTYRETLEITKSITLRGWSSGAPATSDGRHRGYGVTLQPVGNQSGILIHSSEPIVVEILRINVEAALVGIEVSGPVELLVQDVDILDSKIGLYVHDGASVDVVNGYFESNAVALGAEGSSEVNVQDSRILLSWSQMAALQARESSVVAISGTYVQESVGHGVLVAQQAQLSIEDSYILYNDGDGILMGGESRLAMSGSVITSNKGYGIRALSETCGLDQDFGLAAFSGQITGSGNSISSSDTAMGNVLGLSCPDELSFLIEADPDDG